MAYCLEHHSLLFGIMEGEGCAFLEKSFVCIQGKQRVARVGLTRAGALASMWEASLRLSVRPWFATISASGAR